MVNGVLCGCGLWQHMFLSPCLRATVWRCSPAGSTGQTDLSCRTLCHRAFRQIFTHSPALKTIYIISNDFPLLLTRCFSLSLSACPRVFLPLDWRWPEIIIASMFCLKSQLLRLRLSWKWACPCPCPRHVTADVALNLTRARWRPQGRGKNDAWLGSSIRQKALVLQRGRGMGTGAITIF